MRRRKWILPVATGLASAIVLTGPAKPADPTQVSGQVILKDVEQHVFPIGSSPDHVVVVVRAMGANRNTGSSSFLDGALMTSTHWIDMTKGIGQARGYVAYEAADGSWLMSVDEKSQMVMVDDEKSHYSADGTWEFISGTGHYANGHGSGTSKVQCTPSPEVCTVDWSGTFTAAETK